MVNPERMIGDRKPGPGTKLALEDEQKVVERFLATNDSPSQIGDDFGVTKQTVYNILTRHGVKRKARQIKTPGEQPEG